MVAGETSDGRSEAGRIECAGLVKRFTSGSRELCVLDGVDLAVEAGEFACVLGPSGSGKSTLLGLLAGLDRPSEGRIVVDGRDLARLDEDGLAELRRTRLGFVFQSFELLENLTAEENVALPLELARTKGARARARELLDSVGLAERRGHYPAQLSGGQQQRVALARAFGHRPAILFADEPTGNLDAETGERVLGLLLDLRARTGTTLVLVTHDELISARAERRVRLERGRVVSDERVARPIDRRAGHAAGREA